jgi:tripeptidyl-peptidase-1
MRSAFFHFVLPAVLAVSCQASVVPSSQDRCGSAPVGFELIEKSNPTELVTLRFALAQKDYPGLDRALYDASTPGNPAYGRWLTKTEVDSYAGPSEDTLALVDSWLSSHGVPSSSVSRTGNWIQIDTTVLTANQLLEADFTSYRHVETGKIIKRTLSTSPPPHLNDHVLVIHPTTVFPEISTVKNVPEGLDRRSEQPKEIKLQQHAAAPLPESCIRDPNNNTHENEFKPSSLQCRFDLYELPKAPASGQADNQLWITGFDNRFINKNDLKSYLAEFRPEVSSNVSFSLVTIDGGLNNQLPMSADPVVGPMMWVAASTAYGVPLTFMSVGTDTTDDPVTWLIDQANYLLSLEKPPQVVVIPVELFESRIPKEIATNLCNSYGQLAARGVALLHTVGSDGVGLWPGFNVQCPKFEQSFPSACPYVTSVASSSVYYGKEETSPAYWSATTGWSDYFARPSYQDGVVPGYLASIGDTYKGLFNPDGRASKIRNPLLPQRYV